MKRRQKRAMAAGPSKAQRANLDREKQVVKEQDRALRKIERAERRAKDRP